MNKKTGLGKGLNALFADAPIIEKDEEDILQSDNESIKKIKLINIEPNRNQPRRIFDEESIGELAESIKRYGLIQPIVVTKKDDYYQIIAGERRWRASKKARIG